MYVKYILCYIKYCMEYLLNFILENLYGFG